MGSAGEVVMIIEVIVYGLISAGVVLTAWLGWQFFHLTPKQLEDEGF